MPNRILREGILSSDRVNRLTWPAEVFYRRLMSVVDDFGLFDGRTDILRAACYPLKLDTVGKPDVEKWILETEEAALVRRYAVDGKPYIKIMDFRQQVRSTKSKYPPMPEGATHVPSICVAGAQHMHTKTETYPETEAGLRPLTADFEIPSLQEATAYAESPQCGFPPELVQEWLDRKQASGWANVRDWKAAMRASKATYWQMYRERQGNGTTTTERKSKVML